VTISAQAKIHQVGAWKAASAGLASYFAALWATAIRLAFSDASPKLPAAAEAMSGGQFLKQQFRLGKKEPAVYPYTAGIAFLVTPNSPAKQGRWAKHRRGCADSQMKSHGIGVPVADQ
jgi:hypothetical protein